VCIRTEVNAAKDTAPVKYSIDICLQSFDTVDDFLSHEKAEFVLGSEPLVAQSK
jgi:hypothetical protein